MSMQLGQKISNRRNGPALHFRLELRECRIPAGADKHRVNLTRLGSGSRFVRRSQIEQLTPSAPLHSSSLEK